MDIVNIQIRQGNLLHDWDFLIDSKGNVIRNVYEVIGEDEDGIVAV